MVDPLTSGSALLLVFAALAAFAVIVIAVKIAVKIAIRVGIVAAVGLAAYYTAGYLGYVTI